MIALVTISDGRGHLTNAVRSLLDNTEPGTFSQAVMVDDAGLTDNPAEGHHTDEAFDLLHEQMPVTLRFHAQRRGGAAAIQTAWAMLAESDCEYAFHLEEDWTFPDEVPVAEMARILADDPLTANVVLRRQPWGAEGPGGYIGDRPAMFHPRWDEVSGAWLSHNLGFWLNPCLYRVSTIRDYPWPDGGHEHHYTALLGEARFAVYGYDSDPPRAIHVGTERHPSWTW